MKVQPIGSLLPSCCLAIGVFSQSFRSLDAAGMSFLEGL
jgi:hypothetical protein